MADFKIKKSGQEFTISKDKLNNAKVKFTFFGGRRIILTSDKGKATEFKPNELLKKINTKNPEDKDILDKIVIDKGYEQSGKYSKALTKQNPIIQSIWKKRHHKRMETPIVQKDMPISQEKVVPEIKKAPSKPDQGKKTEYAKLKFPEISLNKDVEGKQRMVFLRTLTGQTIPVEYNDKITGEEFPTLLSGKLGYPPTHLKVIYCGKDITKAKDEHGKSPTLNDMKIHEEGQMHLILSPVLSENLNRELSDILQQSEQFQDTDFNYLQGACWSIVDRILMGKAIIGSVNEALNDLSNADDLINASETPNKQVFIDAIKGLRSMLEEAAELNRQNNAIEFLKNVPKEMKKANTIEDLKQLKTNINKALKEIEKLDINQKEQMKINAKLHIAAINHTMKEIITSSRRK